MDSFAPAAYRRFLATLAGGIALLWAAVLAVSVAVDPYALLGLPLSQRLNGSKAVLHHQERLAKAYTLARMRPAMVAFGNSRQGHALDPRHPAFAQAQGAYNAAFDGANIVEMDAYLRHAYHVGGLKHAVIGLDVSSFTRFVPQPAYRPDLLATEHASGAWQRAVGLLRVYSSIDALLDSRASYAQRDAPPVWDVQAGRRTDVVFQARLKGCGGTRENFRIRESRDIRLDTLSGLTPEALDAALEVYRQMLRFAHRAGLRVDLFISPTHARSVVLLELMGRLELFNTWKRRLVQINAEEAQRAGAGGAYPLWDFSGFNPVTTETVPAAGSPQTMDGYWELSHYRQAVGNRVLDRMFPAAARAAPAAGFGVALTPATLEAHLQDQQRAGAAYRSSHADELADLVALARAGGKYQARTGCGVL